MKTEAIAATTGMGAVEVAVTDGDRALRFYRDYVGLTPMPSPDSAIRLGAGARELVVLHPGAERPVVPRTSACITSRSSCRIGASWPGSSPGSVGWAGTSTPPTTS